jgi:hypothetical protein
MLMPFRNRDQAVEVVTDMLRANRVALERWRITLFGRGCGRSYGGWCEIP